MRIIFLFVFLAVQVAYGQSQQNISLDFDARNLSLKQALQKLSTESGVDIAYSSRLFNKSARVNIKLENASLNQVLNKIIEGTALRFDVIGNRIIISRAKLKYFNINGYIEDNESAERLVAATVFCPALNKGAVSNEYGFYSLSLPEGEWDLEYSYLGYQRTKQTVNINDDQRLDMKMPLSITLAEVIVNPDIKDNRTIHQEENNEISISPKMISASPGLGGTEDLLRAAQILPGIQGGVDGLGGIHVRGGDPGQNQMLLDGVPVFIPYHLLGFYSIYNSKTISSAKILKGGISSRYGGSLSSVFDVRTREGSRANWQSSVDLNLVNAGLVAEGPFDNKKGSVLISGRKSHSGFLLTPSLKRIYFQGEDAILNTEFYDLNLKLNYSLGENDRIYLSFFTGFDDFVKEFEEVSDEYKEESELTFQWKNTIGSLRWNHLFNNRLFLNTTITYSSYGFEYSSLNQFFEDESPNPEELYFLDSRTANQDLGAKLDFDFIPDPNHTLRFGFGLADKSFSPDITYFDADDIEFDDDEEDEVEVQDFDSLIVSSETQAKEAFIYLEDRFRLSNQIVFTPGVRVSTFWGEDFNHFNIEPRLRASYAFTSKLRLFATASKMIQYLHLASNAALRLPNDLWFPSSEELVPQQAWQYEFGLQGSFNKHFSASVETYYKKMDNLFTYPSNFEFFDEINESPPEDLLINGYGVAYGIEFMLKYQDHKRAALLSYTLARADRQFEDENLGLEFPYQFDQRHQFKLFVHHKIGKGFDVGFNGVFFTGHPRINLSFVEFNRGIRTVDPNPEGQKNGVRARAYNRFDFNLGYTAIGEKLRHEIKIGVYNGTNTNNIIYYEVDPEDSAYPVGALPVLPSLSYSLKF